MKNLQVKLSLAKWLCRLIIISDGWMLFLTGLSWGSTLGYILLGVMTVTSLVYFDVYLWVMRQTLK